jgi:hypothetical protein
MKKYEFKNIEIVNLDELIDDSEVTGTLLKAYARIPLHDGPAGGDQYGGGPDCDSAGPTNPACIYP